MNIFTKIYESRYALDECDGCSAAGGIPGGDMSGGVPAGPAGGITSDSVLGPAGEFEKGHGCLGHGDFHIPFPVGKLMRRFPIAKSCCNGGGSKKSHKKHKKVKNPYAVGAKTIIGEGSTCLYRGDAKQQYDQVINGQQEIYDNILYYNDTYHLAWLVKDDGILHMYKPFNTGSFWTIYATHLQPDGLIMLDYKAGRYMDENSALTAVYKAAEEHRHKLNEVKKQLDERRFDPKDIMNWEAHGRDLRYAPWEKHDNVNIYALQNELKQKFYNQFKSVQLKSFGDIWKAEFSVNGITEKITGQQKVKTLAIPLINQIMSLLRIRGIDINSYNVSAVPAE